MATKKNTPKSASKTSTKTAGKKVPAAGKPGRKRSLTDAQVADAVSRAKNGATVAEIHALRGFGEVSPATIANAIRRVMGERPRGRKAPSDAVKREMAKIYKAGDGMGVVAEQTGFSVPTVRAALEELNVEIRTAADYSYADA